MERDASVILGVVEDLRDPESLGRVKLRFPNVGDTTSDWARFAAPMAGNGFGAFFRPEVGDEVLVAFEHGDNQRPYVLGSVWNKSSPPPPDDARASDNNWRQIRSRSGHLLRFDDTSGGEKIEIVDKDERRRIVIDAAGDKIRIVCDQGDIEIKAKGSLKLEAQTVEIKADSSLKIEAGSDLKVKGATVDIN